MNAVSPVLEDAFATAALSSVWHHPDADLLDVCAKLRAQAEEWQRLYDLTSTEEKLTTPADFAFNDYDEKVWPGDCSPDREPEPHDLVGRLRVLRATTTEGKRAKAAAIIAVEESGHYTGNCRYDYCSIVMSLLEDVAEGTELRIGAERKVMRWRARWPCSLSARPRTTMTVVPSPRRHVRFVESAAGRVGR